MISFIIDGQSLKVNQPIVASDTINYIEAKFDFRTSDWEGLSIFAHFKKKNIVYDVPVYDNKIEQSAGLNLENGEWEVYLHGNAYEQGNVIERITTEVKRINVKATGILNGEPFPSSIPSISEQILATIGDISELETEDRNNLVDAINEIAERIIPPGTIDHDELRNRDISNQHPIDAIIGLQDALDSKQPIGNYVTNSQFTQISNRVNNLQNELINEETLRIQEDSAIQNGMSIISIRVDDHDEAIADIYYDVDNIGSRIRNVETQAVVWNNKYSKPYLGIPKTDLASEVRSALDGVERLAVAVPTQASATNQLADKDFVNSSIQNVVAFYITMTPDGQPFDTYYSLANATVYYSSGHVVVPSRNDYCIVLHDESHIIPMTGEYPTTRYIFNDHWYYQYTVNNSGLTAAQWTAVNSGITSALVSDIRSNTQHIGLKQDIISDLDSIRSGAQAGASAYQKPSTGIPYQDMSSGVKSALDAAGTALTQSHIVHHVTNNDSKIPTSAAVYEELQHKQDEILDLNDIRMGANDGLGAYHKPDDGIPISDMDSGISHSIQLANGAIQKSDVESESWTFITNDDQTIYRNVLIYTGSDPL